MEKAKRKLSKCPALIFIIDIKHGAMLEPSVPYHINFLGKVDCCCLVCELQIYGSIEM